MCKGLIAKCSDVFGRLEQRIKFYNPEMEHFVRFQLAKTASILATAALDAIWADAVKAVKALPFAHAQPIQP
jgi:hypothetical protein